MARAPAPARTGQDTARRLDELRPAYERLTAARIRAEGEVERLAAELEAARHLAREELGTDDEGEIARLIEAARAENAAAVEAFAAELQAIDARLGRLGEDG